MSSQKYSLCIRCFWVPFTIGHPPYYVAHTDGCEYFQSEYNIKWQVGGCLAGGEERTDWKWDFIWMLL